MNKTIPNVFVQQLVLLLILLMASTVFVSFVDSEISGSSGENLRFGRAAAKFVNRSCELRNCSADEQKCQKDTIEKCKKSKNVTNCINNYYWQCDEWEKSSPKDCEKDACSKGEKCYQYAYNSTCITKTLLSDKLGCATVAGKKCRKLDLPSTPPCDAKCQDATCRSLGFRDCQDKIEKADQCKIFRKKNSLSGVDDCDNLNAADLKCAALEYGHCLWRSYYIQECHQVLKNTSIDEAVCDDKNRTQSEIECFINYHMDCTSKKERIDKCNRERNDTKCGTLKKEEWECFTSGFDDCGQKKNLVEKCEQSQEVNERKQHCGIKSKDEMACYTLGYESCSEKAKLTNDCGNTCDGLTKTEVQCRMDGYSSCADKVEKMRTTPATTSNKCNNANPCDNAKELLNGDKSDIPSSPTIPTAESNDQTPEEEEAETNFVGFSAGAFQWIWICIFLFYNE